MVVNGIGLDVVADAKSTLDIAAESVNTKDIAAESDLNVA